MAAVWYNFVLRNDGALAEGLEPSFKHLKKMASGFPDITPSDILEVGDGVYAFQYDPEADGEASAMIDAGSAVTSPAERYVPLFLALDSSRIQYGIAADGTVRASQLGDKSGYALAADGLDAVMVENEVNARETLAYIAAAVAGRGDGAGTGQMSYYAIGPGNDGIIRLKVATPGNGNRSSVTYYPPS